MKKRYKIENMIKNSRLVYLYADSDDEKKKYIDKRVGELIENYSEYQCKPLYGYLCNLFSSIAICEYDESIGMSREDAINEVRTYMEEFMKPSKDKYEKLFAKKWIWPIARLIIPKMMTLANGKGFETKVVKGKKNEMGFDTTKCIFTTILKELGRMDLACMYCGIDEYMYSNLPGITFKRTGTCSRGNSCCDFRFTKNEEK